MAKGKSHLAIGQPQSSQPAKGPSLVLALGLAAAIVLALAGCPLFFSGEALIVSFDIDGIVGVASIDADQKTVVATVEPVDVSTIEPTMIVSEGATVTTSTLVDGLPVTFTVRAANGTEVAWHVTVNVQYGVSFTYGTTRVVMTRGLVDSSNTYTADVLGNGTPAGTLGGGTTSVFAGPDDLEILGFDGRQVDVYFNGQAGDYDSASSHMTYNYDGAAWYYQAVPGWSLHVGTYDPVGGSIEGTFSATGYPGEDPQGALNGFFKVRRIEDNQLWNTQ